MKLSDEQKSAMSGYGIPDYMHGAIVRFYENGLEPGSLQTNIVFATTLCGFTMKLRAVHGDIPTPYQIG